MANSQASRRVNERLLEYWQQLRGNRMMPFEQEVDPKAIGDIWDSCFMVRHEADAEPTEFRYIYLGEDLIEAYGDEIYAKEICEKLAYPQNNDLLEKFSHVIEKKSPQNVESEFTNASGLLIKYRSCLLPLAKETTDVASYVIGAMKWRAF